MITLPMDEVKLLVIINAGTLVAILTLGIKVIRFLNTIEFQNDLMWRDYQIRMKRIYNEEDN